MEGAVKISFPFIKIVTGEEISRIKGLKYIIDNIKNP